MFALIVTIISVFLVAALAIATLYYGGDFVSDGQARAAMTKILQEGNQVVGALELYKADNGGFPAGTSDEIKTQLVAQNYLKQIPSGNWEFRNDFAVRTDLDESACLTINKKVGVNLVPSCTDTAYAGRTLCCSTN